MLFSIALILLCGMTLGWICKKMHLPPLLGMILTGILLGPHATNLLDETLLGISPQIRRIALIIILMRAGLNLDLKDLKKVGRPAVLMCFVPATLEILGMVLLAPKLFPISITEALLMGSVLAAVSPAVIVPKMLKLMEEGYGTKEAIPQMILAGASVDDVFVIVLFTAFTGLVQGNGISPVGFLQIPVSIITGILFGALIGILISYYFQKIHLRDTAKILILLSIAFLLVTLEDNVPAFLPFSGLLAIMSMGIFLRKKRKVVTERLSVKFNKLWVGAEILLFVLVGATVDLPYAVSAGAGAVLLIFGVLFFRMLGVFLCMLGTKITYRQRLFCMFAYLPKATVQAAIGGIPLSLGLSCGNLILTVAVLAILITAPFGAFLIDLTHTHLLNKSA